MLLLFFAVSAVVLKDVEGFLQDSFGYGRYPRPFGMNNFGFPPPIPQVAAGGASSWNPYYYNSAPMLPSMNFNARGNFGFGGIPNFNGFGGGGGNPMDMIAPPFYPNNNNNNFGGGGNGFFPSNYGNNNQWPYYPNNNNNNNWFTQKPYSPFPIIPTLPSSAINSNSIITTTTPTVPVTSFLK